jgi:hypothetical protein
MSSTNLSRRAIVAGAASVPALAVPAIALASTEPDPIFAAIERWKKFLAIENASYDARDNAIDEANVATLDQASDEACDQRCDATYAIFDMVPTTLAGMRAKIDFAFDEDFTTGLLMRNTRGDVVVKSFLDTLYAAARLMAVQS